MLTTQRDYINPFAIKGPVQYKIDEPVINLKKS